MKRLRTVVIILSGRPHGWWSFLESRHSLYGINLRSFLSRHRNTGWSTKCAHAEDFPIAQQSFAEGQ